jgi:hypothetical protein
MKRKLGICFFVACFLAVIGINSMSLRKNTDAQSGIENGEYDALGTDDGEFVKVGTETGTGAGSDGDTEADVETDLEVNSIVNQNSNPDDKYIIYAEDGILVVYYADRTTVFFNSGVRADALPTDLQECLSSGISFANEAELYEFLENYSS